MFGLPDRSRLIRLIFRYADFHALRAVPAGTRLYHLMDRRQFIKRVIQGERSDRVPRALFGAGRWAYRQAGLRIDSLDRNPRLFAEKIAVLFRDLDTDMVFPGSGLNTFPAEAIGGDLVFRDEQAPLLSSPIIGKREDAEFFQDIDISGSPRTLALLEMAGHLRKRLSGHYLCATSWGPFTWAMILCDWNQLQDKAATDATFVREVCDLGVRLSTALFGPLIDEGLVDGIVLSDGAATLIPADLYRAVVLPLQKKLFDRFRSRGIGLFLHMCGNIDPQLSLYPETGADCVTLDAGIDLGAVYRMYRERVVTAGNVDVVKTVFGGNRSLIREAVSATLTGIPDPLRKFILMPSCDLPPETPMEHAKTFLAAADGWTLKA